MAADNNTMLNWNAELANVNHGECFLTSSLSDSSALALASNSFLPSPEAVSD